MLLETVVPQAVLAPSIVLALQQGENNLKLFLTSARKTARRSTQMSTAMETVVKPLLQFVGQDVEVYDVSPIRGPEIHGVVRRGKFLGGVVQEERLKFEIQIETEIDTLLKRKRSATTTTTTLVVCTNFVVFLSKTI